MTSSNGNIFRVTGPLCGEFTGARWIPRTKASDAELCVFFDLRLNKRLSKQSWGWWFETQSGSLWRHCKECSFMLTTNPQQSFMFMRRIFSRLCQKYPYQSIYRLGNNQSVTQVWELMGALPRISREVKLIPDNMKLRLISDLDIEPVSLAFQVLDLNIRGARTDSVYHIRKYLLPTFLRRFVTLTNRHWEIWIQFQIRNVESDFNNWWLGYILLS